MNSKKLWTPEATSEVITPIASHCTKITDKTDHLNVYRVRLISNV